jgi:DMSO/TMAO reductase YedYZ heme-binding membrane subunit
VNDAAAAPSRSRRLALAGTAATSVLALASVALLASLEHWPVARELVLSRGSGWIALGALLLSLSATPVGRLARRFFGRDLPAVGVTRRALGMTSAWLACVHAALALCTTLQWSWAAIPHWPHLRAGLTALCVLALLFATSFRQVIVWLRLGFFRELHRLSYVAALLALQHVLLSPFAPRTLTLLLFGATFLLGLARFL